MKREVFKDGYCEGVIETFDSFNELVRVTKSRKSNFGCSRIEKGGEWRGCDSLEQAQEMMLNGVNDREKIKKIKSKIEQFHKRQEGSSYSRYNEVYGYAPVVPNAILGLPKSMVNSKMNPKKQKVVNLIIDIGVPASVSPESFESKIIEVISKAISLEKSGYRIRIDLSKAFNKSEGNKLSYILKFCLKKETQPIDIKKMIFPLSNVAITRYIAFDWYESCPKAKEIDGYGYSMTIIKRDNKRMYEFLKSKIITRENTILFHYGLDVDEVFKCLK